MKLENDCLKRGTGRGNRVNRDVILIVWLRRVLFHWLLQDGGTTIGRPEVVGWDGIDPLPELPLFHATADESFGGSLFIVGEPAIFWL